MIKETGNYDKFFLCYIEKSKLQMQSGSNSLIQQRMDQVGFTVWKVGAFCYKCM